MDHQHTLQLINGPQTSSFMCSGCKELGRLGCSYICENRNCNYILHQECAQPVKHAVHPFFINCIFEFYENPKNQCCGFCDACGKDLLGFFYLCPKTRYALHPCCLNLQNTISSEGTVILRLCHDVPSDCVKCKQRYVVRNQFKGWSYVMDFDRKTCCHVSCFNDLMLQSSINNEETSTGSKGRIRKRSLLKFTGKLLIDLVLGDFSSIGTIVEVVEELLSDN